MCLPCQALPRRALPSLAPPRKLQRPRGAAVCLPCQAMPRLAAPRLARPSLSAAPANGCGVRSHDVPRQAVPRQAVPRQTTTAPKGGSVFAVPCQAQPRHAPPSYFKSFRASPTGSFISASRVAILASSDSWRSRSRFSSVSRRVFVPKMNPRLNASSACRA